ncbi:hypothetical protein SBFV2_gp07 [Sulfolobales Beppu filamentous virus 2]|uniref:Uncharacterized protein n=1 Tax=Sulfolobales Beppu filamentous virus 2 TaxID=2493123 RepID=A0A3Q8Q3P2_9VIRU|nr:hypothetical protein HOU84_gp07 [Sulfolobales Beppu filamentous virus 2]AZI75774.1 hypothetical protein SBFV2_gp07 [Sulfolobales Beppu filamentous virus 2]
MNDVKERISNFLNFLHQNHLYYLEHSVKKFGFLVLEVIPDDKFNGVSIEQIKDSLKKDGFELRYINNSY